MTTMSTITSSAVATTTALATSFSTIAVIRDGIYPTNLPCSQAGTWTGQSYSGVVTVGRGDIDAWPGIKHCCGAAPVSILANGNKCAAQCAPVGQSLSQLYACFGTEEGLTSWGCGDSGNQKCDDPEAVVTATYTTLPTIGASAAAVASKSSAAAASASASSHHKSDAPRLGKMEVAAVAVSMLSLVMGLAI